MSKLLMSRDYLIAFTYYKQSNAFLMRRRRRRSAVSPWNVDPLRSTTLRGIRSARSVGQRSFRSFLCPTPKVTPRFSLDDVGEARWPLSHRWTDTSFTLPDAAHNSRNQGHVVSLSELVEPPLGVRPTLPAARGSSQLAAIAEFLVTDAERRNRRVTFLLHIISDVTRVRHAQGTTFSILRVFIACAAAVQTAVLGLARRVWGTIGRCRGVLPRTNARCVVGQ